MFMLVRVLIGIALLTLGRKLFWLFVGAVGFEVGVYIAMRFFRDQPELTMLLIALGLGLVAALLAIFLQEVVISGAGFLAGGYLLTNAVDLLGLEFGWANIIAFLIGGVIGAVIVALLFEWALIGLSSLIGAFTLTTLFLPRNELAFVVIVVLLILGVAIQSGWFWYEGRRARSSS